MTYIQRLKIKTTSQKGVNMTNFFKCNSFTNGSEIAFDSDVAMQTEEIQSISTVGQVAEMHENVGAEFVKEQTAQNEMKQSNKNTEYVNYYRKSKKNKLLIDRETLFHVFVDTDFASRHPFHVDIAEGFADIHQDVLRFCNDGKNGCWYYYNGKVWQVDQANNFARAYASQFAKELRNYAINTVREESFTKLVCSYDKKRDNLLEDAKSHYSFSMKDFDEPFAYDMDKHLKEVYARRKNLLNCQNGTLDLETFQFREHRAEDMLFEITNVAYDPKAVSKLFEKAIYDYMDGWQDRIDILQKTLGYALLSDNRYAKIFIFHGNGRNGKSVLSDVMIKLLGYGYASSRQPETFAVSHRKAGAAYEDLASVRGLRFLSVNEPPEGMVLDAAVLKAFSGNDPMAFRGIYSKIDIFHGGFKLFMLTNYLPQINDDCIFTSGRVIVIPFTKPIPPDQQDCYFLEKLTTPENLSGILNWLLEGLKKLKADNGFKLSPAMQEEIEDFRRQTMGITTGHGSKLHEKIRSFLDDTLVGDSNSNISGNELYLEYRNWCLKNRGIAMGKVDFYSVLKDMNIMYPSGTINGFTQRNVVVGYRWKESPDAIS